MGGAPTAGHDQHHTRTGQAGAATRATGPPRIGDLAARHGLILHELTPKDASLEEAFMHFTRDAVAYRPHTVAGKAA